MNYLDHWHDWWRLVNALVCLAALVGLASHFKNYHRDWNSAARDLWYALSVCMFGSVAISLESIVLDHPLGIRTPLILAAGLVTFKAVVDRDHWRPRHEP